MSSEQDPGRLVDFGRVDEDSLPQAFIDYLRQLQEAPWLQPIKEDALARLALEPGQTVIDVGCGIGEDTRTIARIVGEDGFVIGLDNSQQMLRVARDETPSSMEDRVAFYRGNAQELILPDNSIDAYRSERTFQHLPEPDNAIAEAIRVVKPGGKIVIIDSNWGGLEMKGGADADEAWFKGLFHQEVQNPTLAGELADRFRAGGLTGVRDTVHTFETWDFSHASEVMNPQRTFNRALQQGLMSASEVQRSKQWVSTLQGSDRFIGRTKLHVVSGVKPR